MGLSFFVHRDYAGMARRFAAWVSGSGEATEYIPSVNARAIASSVDASIASNASLSGAIDLAGGRLAAIKLPTGLEGTKLTFQASIDGSTFVDLYDEAGNEVTYTVGANRMVRPPVADWLGFAWLKIRTGTSASPTVQTAARSLTVVTVL